MKHGYKTKEKASKASGKKSAAGAAKSSKAGLKAKTQGSVAKASSSRAKGNGAYRSSADVNFSNPAVATAFKRAVKKYPNAFRRLTD